MAADYVRTEYASGPSVYTVDRLVTPDECAHIIELARDRLRRGAVSGEEGGFESPGRSGSTAWISHDTDPLTLLLCERLAALIDMPLSHAESLQVVHYAATEQYKPHFDAYDLSSAKGQRATANGGQRLVTALAYLNDDFEGGSTAFPKLNVEVEPAMGRVVVFENCEPDLTTVHPKSLHAGTPVTSGEKWAANLWFRARPRNKSGQTGGSKTKSETTEATRKNRRGGVVLANRANKHVEAAVEDLWPNGSLPANITYWDTFGGSLPDDSALDPDLPTLRLLPRSVTAPLDNKARFATEIARHGLEHIIPSTFLSRDDALRMAHKGETWIVKAAHLSAGRGFQILETHELEHADLGDSFVIQRLVEDPLLIEDRRVTMRALVLSWAQRLFVFDDGRTRLSSAPWETGSTDWDQIVGHRGGATPDDLRVASEVHPVDFGTHAAQIMQDLKPLFGPILDATSLVDYQLGAIDFTLTDDGRAFVFEFNAVPNFLQGEPLDEAVNGPLFTEMLRLMCAGGSNRFVEI